MDFLLEALTNWLKEMLVGGIMSNLSGMFDSVNQQVADISVQVGQTPQGWNGSIFSMIENLSNSIMVPIAGVILAIVMTVDLIQMIADKNNLHDVDTWMIFKWVFKSAAAILIVTNTWNIVMGVFDMAQSVVAQAAGVINSDASIDISSVMTDLEPRLMEMDLGPLFGLWFQSLFIGITMWALYICMKPIPKCGKRSCSLRSVPVRFVSFWAAPQRWAQAPMCKTAWWHFMTWTVRGDRETLPSARVVSSARATRILLSMCTAM